MGICLEVDVDEFGKVFEESFKSLRLSILLVVNEGLYIDEDNTHFIDLYGTLQFTKCFHIFSFLRVI